MLERLEVKNYRGFEQHSLPLKPLTVVVGENNAGKSTLVEALRLLALCAARARTLAYKRPPQWAERPARELGISPSLRNLEIKFRTLTHRYGDPPSVVIGRFSNGSTIRAYIGSEQLYAVVLDRNGRIVRDRASASRAMTEQIAIMPQIAPLQESESVLDPDYVKSAASSHLAPLHFRNQLNVYYDQFEAFQQVVEERWPGVQIRELSGRRKAPGSSLELLVRNEDFVAEVGSMGHGLQMWLQAMWFLTRSEHADTVILDEPDVYMHPDLQRRLVRFVTGSKAQVILTSHSVELMSEVEPDQILVVDKGRRESRFASSLPAVQRVLDNVGSAHNVHLARLWKARRFVLVEGKDMKLLGILHRTLFPGAVPFGAIPNMQIGGWGGWSLAVGSSMALRNAAGDTITTYALFDSDYHSGEECRERHAEALARGVSLHIWSRKEIENYLLVPEAIARYIQRRAAARTVAPNASEVTQRLEAIGRDLEEDAFDAMSTHLQAQHRGWAAGTANKRARACLKKRSEGKAGLLGVVSGKAAISALSAWSQEQFGISLPALGLAVELTAREIDAEVQGVIKAIEECEVLPESAATP